MAHPAADNAKSQLHQSGHPLNIAQAEHIDSVEERLEALEARVAALEARVAALEAALNTPQEPPTEDTDDKTHRHTGRRHS